MKKKYIYGALLSTSVLFLGACKKFDEISRKPTAASVDQVQVEYFINNSIMGAQQNPDVAERAFVLYWKTLAHQQYNTGVSSGSYNDQWTTAYYNQTASWQNHINTAIEVANEQLAAGTNKPYTENLLQVSRIWRAYLMSEMSDIFGPIPINAFQGKNPDFVDVKTVYYYLLDELKDASAKMDISIDIQGIESVEKQDPVYKYNFAKWQKYANSLRMRLAMRLSEVDAAKAKEEFEAAVASEKYILNSDETFQVQEKDGWHDLTGVMSREWNAQFISPTLYNLYMNLGGVKSAEQVNTTLQSAIKPQNYIGLKFENHFPSKTNDPSIGYWLDGLPYAIDPRAYKTFIIPGDFTNPDFNSYPSWTTDAKNTVRTLTNVAGEVVKTIDAKYTFNYGSNGSWGEYGSLNKLINYEGTIPRLANRYRNSTAKRIFFAPWETYFLMAEAAVKGWSVPISGKDAYEAGIKASFEYVGAPISSYLTSKDYNRAGTSVNWDHTVEPGDSHTMNYINGYTGAAGVATIAYPKNGLYKNGSVRNDLLTKIITQKYLAQVPWLPLEAWSDHRRLGLPFFENPAVTQPLANLPALNSSNYMTSSVKFFPQRIKYPSDLPKSNAEGYNKAVSALNGADDLWTPLWWAKKE